MLIKDLTFSSPNSQEREPFDPYLLSVSRLCCVPLLRATRRISEGITCVKPAGRGFYVALLMHLNGPFPRYC